MINGMRILKQYARFVFNTRRLTIKKPRKTSRFSVNRENFRDLSRNAKLIYRSVGGSMVQLMADKQRITVTEMTSDNIGKRHVCAILTHTGLN